MEIPLQKGKAFLPEPKFKRPTVPLYYKTLLDHQRFCFLSLDGKFEYDIEYPQEFSVQKLNLYYDTESQWPLVYGPKSSLTTCREKESVLQVENNQFINLTSDVIYSGCRQFTVRNENKTFYRCRGSRNFKTARERWWFIAISNCQSTNGLSLRYRLWLTNGHPQDYFHYHFSADEFYILPILLGYGFINLLLLFGAVRTAMHLKSRQLYHVTYKMFLCSVLLQGFGIFLLTLAYMTYGFNGHGMPSGKLLGRILESASEIVFMLLLIVIAKGYTVTRARLRTWSSIKVTVFICAYILCYKAIFVAEQMYFDPGSVLYLYESVWGYVLVILRVVGWVMFIYATFFTLKHYPEKGGFYYPFFCFYTLWFIAGPVVIVLGNMYIPRWLREKVVCSVEHGIALMGHAVFLLLTRPSAHNKNFPYHVRTAQIGIMEAQSSNTGLGPHTLDKFGHHGYEAQYIQSSRNYDVFTVESMQTMNTWGQTRPVVRPPLPLLATAPIPNTPEEEGGQDVKVSPPPPYTPTVYDPNAADTLEEWDDKNKD